MIRDLCINSLPARCFRGGSLSGILLRMFCRWLLSGGLAEWWSCLPLPLAPLSLSEARATILGHVSQQMIIAAKATRYLLLFGNNCLIFTPMGVWSIIIYNYNLFDSGLHVIFQWGRFQLGCRSGNQGIVFQCLKLYASIKLSSVLNTLTNALYSDLRHGVM